MQELTRDAAGVVRRARRAVGETQREFGVRVGRAQSLICKYERGDVSPPAELLIHCMNLIKSTQTVTTDELAELIRVKLAGADMAPVRQAVASLIECVYTPVRGTPRD